MAEQDDARVGVYIDFDNIVISRADQARDEGFADATVDLDAIIDFASSYGTVIISRAYADWSQKKNADYREQLVKRAVDLTQLFPVSRTKNGADIRLAIDVVEDMFRHGDLTHIVIVAGDSDYIPLAQRAKRLGRTVIGIGVAGSVSRRLAAATDEYRDYDTLPGVDEPELVSTAVEPEPEPQPTQDAKSGPRPQPAVGSSRATQLLVRAIRLLREKDDLEWFALGTIKHQMLRMEPGFQETALGFDQFSKFVASRGNLVEVKNGEVRLRPAADKVAAG
jgi:uncharacterized LabA/DUF88 family protein